MEHFQKPTDKS